MKRRHFIISATVGALATLAVFPSVAFAVEEPLAKDEKNVSFRNEIRDVLTRGLDFIVKQQNADGSFGTDLTHPALSALPLVALQREPTGRFMRSPQPETMQKGYTYLRGFVQPDGGIYNPQNGLANYNTAVALLALFNAENPADQKILQAARAYVVGQQASGLDKEGTDGGIGYGNIGASPKRGHPDLDNTLVSLEALKITKSIAADKPGTKDLNWQAAIDFVARCQNLPETNKMEWASGDEKNKGGFVYYPGYSNAGKMDLEGGKTALRSYGSMSYAGLLSFIYADLKKDDPRVAAAIEWLRKNYTLDENPGMEMQGYYYYLHLMAKGLASAEIDALEVGGKKIDWRRELGLKLMKLQKPDGSWANPEPRWKEANPVLVSAYCTMALSIIYNQL
jgi:squalene-hopene/tetraprenyl-beta-curcumene cyclase